MPPRATTIEKDPLNNGCSFGWGEDTDPIHHRLYKERIEAEKCENEGVYSEIRSLVLAKGEESPIEKLLREQMPYDDGWDFDFVDKLLWKLVPYVNQNPIGSCVGAGAASAVASKSASEILVEGDSENPYGMEINSEGKNTSLPQCAIPCVDYHYGAGKMKPWWNGEQFNGSRSLGDGSYCSAQIWALKTCGVLPCNEVKDSGLVFPQTGSIRRHAGNGNDFLNKHLEIGQKHLMKDSTRVNSADDLKEVITILKQPCMICSGWGFGPAEQVDGLGWVYRRSGSWPHNMSIVACVLWKGTWYVKVRNQWGRGAHKDGWHFWITLDLFASWVRGAECQSIGELDLYPSSSVLQFPF